MHLPSFQSPRTRNIAWQAIAVGAVAGLVAWFAWNALGNFDIRRVGFGLDFLSRPANIPIAETLVAYAPGDANHRAILVGLLNSILVAFFGILFATLLGTALGIARLSGNYVASRIALAYVEFVRNIPLLAHLFVIYLILQQLPPLRSAVSVGDIAFLSNRGLVVPALQAGDGTSALFAVAIALFAGTLVLRAGARHFGHRNAALAGVLRGVVRIGLATALATALYAFSSLTVSLPALKGRAFAGGHTISPEFTALVLGLTVYYASFIAEIVRGGILSVPKGQWEAAQALGFRRGRTLQLIVLPQALRLMIPPTTSQYLDLAKMTSLAIAIGYPDLVAVVNSIITDTGRAIESVATIMAAFLLINLAISTFMNWLNLRVALLGRTK